MGTERSFILMMRPYDPRETAPSIIDGSWKPPGGEEGTLTAQARIEHMKRKHWIATSLALLAIAMFIWASS
jgi:hypothetical protein